MQEITDVLRMVPLHEYRAGRWKIVRSDFEVKEEFNYRGKPVPPSYDTYPWQAILIGLDGIEELSIMSTFHEPYNRSCLFEMKNLRENKNLGYFTEEDLRAFFDRTRIENRPNYHEAAQRTREQFIRVQKLRRKVKTENPGYYLAAR